jgi:hypothetical protein
MAGGPCQGKFNAGSKPARLNQGRWFAICAPSFSPYQRGFLRRHAITTRRASDPGNRILYDVQNPALDLAFSDSPVNQAQPTGIIFPARNPFLMDTQQHKKREKFG